MIFFFNMKITIYYNDLGQLGLTCQICDPDYKTIITPQKTNKKITKPNFQSTMLNVEIEKKNQLKNGPKKMTQVNLLNSYLRL